MALEFIWLLALTLGPVLPVGVCLPLLRQSGVLGPGGIIAGNRGLDQLEFLLLRLAGGLALVGAGVVVQADVSLPGAVGVVGAGLQLRALGQQAHEAAGVGAGHAHGLIDRAARQIQVGAIGFEPISFDQDQHSLE